MNRETDKADLIKEEAVEVAKTLVTHAQEVARQMLLNTNLDTSKIPLICNKIVRIQEDIGEIKNHIEKTSDDMSELKNWRGYIIGVATIAMILIPVIYYLNTSKIDDVKAQATTLGSQYNTLNGKLDGILQSLRNNPAY